MTFRQILGYTIAGIHGMFACFVVLIPLISSNIVLLASVFTLNIVTIISWLIFDNKCMISVLEDLLLNDKICTWDTYSIASYNKLFGWLASESTLIMINTLGPYLIVFFTGCKMLPLLAAM